MNALHCVCLGIIPELLPPRCVEMLQGGAHGEQRTVDETVASRIWAQAIFSQAFLLSRVFSHVLRLIVVAEIVESILDYRCLCPT